MKLCIDTNVYSAFKSGDDRITALLEEADEILVPSVVLGELFAGFFLGSNQRKNLFELEEFLDMPGIHTVNIDAGIAERYGSIIKVLKKQGTPMPTNDIWIASAAMETNAKLLSYDKHFDHIPGSLLITIPTD